MQFPLKEHQVTFQVVPEWFVAFTANVIHIPDMPSRYLNATSLPTGRVINIPVAPMSMSAPTGSAATVNTCDCEALRTAVILFSGLNAGKKGAETKQAEYDRLKGAQKERKGLLWRSVIHATNLHSVIAN
jgi:hypothetical protein